MKIILFILMLMLTGCESNVISDQMTEKLTTMDSFMNFVDWLEQQEIPEDIHFTMTFVDVEGNQVDFADSSEISMSNNDPIEEEQSFELQVSIEELNSLTTSKEDYLEQKGLEDLVTDTKDLKEKSNDAEEIIINDVEDEEKEEIIIEFKNPARLMTESEARNALEVVAKEEWKDNMTMIEVAVNEGLSAFQRLQLLDIACEKEERILANIWMTWSENWSGFNPVMIELTFLQEVHQYFIRY